MVVATGSGPTAWLGRLFPFSFPARSVDSSGVEYFYGCLRRHGADAPGAIGRIAAARCDARRSFSQESTSFNSFDAHCLVAAGPGGNRMRSAIEFLGTCHVGHWRDDQLAGLRLWRPLSARIQNGPE